jgi:RNA polymerase sigma-70 factor (ECF subfamily)
MRKMTPSIDPITEGALVEEARLRNPKAIRIIMQKHNRRLYRIARSIVRDDHSAEDVLQEAYLRAFARLAEFRQEATLGTWLTRIVMNEALQHVRRSRSAIRRDEQGAFVMEGRVIPFPLVSSHPDPERKMAQMQIQSILEQAIDALPDKFRFVLVARVLENMSVEDTARLLGLRVETVKTRLHRARQLLRKDVERQIGPVLMDAFPFAGRRCERFTAAVLERLARKP